MCLAVQDMNEMFSGKCFECWMHADRRCQRVQPFCGYSLETAWLAGY